MSETTTTSEQGVRRAYTPGKGGLAGRLTVGEYVGQVAAEAAQAVRRAGLRPGLDRSFGCSPDLFGQVVAQDPPAGSELARNGLVTLYVAAPSVVQAEENGIGGVDEQSRVPEPVDVPSEQDTLEWDPVSVADPAQPRTQRRTRGLARSLSGRALTRGVAGRTLSVSGLTLRRSVRGLARSGQRMSLRTGSLVRRGLSMSLRTGSSRRVWTTGSPNRSQAGEADRGAPTRTERPVASVPDRPSTRGLSVSWAGCWPCGPSWASRRCSPDTG